MRTVGVEYDGMVLVVGFEVNGDSSTSAITGQDFIAGAGIDIIEISEFTEGRVKTLDPDYAEVYASDKRFRLATLYAIADFNGEDFNPQTFRRMN